VIAANPVYNRPFLLTWCCNLRSLGYLWGIGGVILLLSFAIYRLAPMALELRGLSLSSVQLAALLFCVVYMAYAEGYKGFHQGFAPRVVARARYLHDNPRPGHILLAPLFCMGYIHATRRRQLLSIGLTLMVICFVIVARMLPQPWRGILDAGVVVGLTIGIGSIAYFMLALSQDKPGPSVPIEVPGEA